MLQNWSWNCSSNRRRGSGGYRTWEWGVDNEGKIMEERAGKAEREIRDLRQKAFEPGANTLEGFLHMHAAGAAEAVTLAHTPDQGAEARSVGRVIHLFDDAADIDREAHLDRKPEGIAGKVEDARSFDGGSRKEGARRKHAATADQFQLLFHEREDLKVPGLHDLRHVALAHRLRVHLAHGGEVDHVALGDLLGKNRSEFDLDLIGRINGGAKPDRDVVRYAFTADGEADRVEDGALFEDSDAGAAGSHVYHHNAEFLLALREDSF